MNDFTIGKIYSVFEDPTIRFDIIVNNFNMREVIVNVLQKYNTGHTMDLMPEEVEVIAEEIQSEFGRKMGLKQEGKNE